MLGFAILMFGMQTMSGAVEPLRSNEAFTNMLTMFSNPLMGILVGILFTAVIQSASAAVGVLQALSVTGILTFASAFAVRDGHPDLCQRIPDRTGHRGRRGLSGADLRDQRQ